MSTGIEACPSCGRPVANRFRSDCFYCGAALPFPGRPESGRPLASPSDSGDSNEPAWRFADEASVEAPPAPPPPPPTLFDVPPLPPLPGPDPPPARPSFAAGGRGRLSAPPAPRPILRAPLPERLPEVPPPEPGAFDRLRQAASGTIGQLVLWTAAAAVLAAILLELLPGEKEKGTTSSKTEPVAAPKKTPPPPPEKPPSRVPDVVITAEGPSEIVRGGTARFVIRARNREDLPVSVVMRRISPVFHDCGRDGGDEVIGWGSSLVVPPGGELVVWNASPMANPTCPDAAEREIWARQDIDFDLRWTRKDRTEDQFPAEGSTNVSLQWKIVPPFRAAPGEGERTLPWGGARGD